MMGQRKSRALVLEPLEGRLSLSHAGITTAARFHLNMSTNHHVTVRHLPPPRPMTHHNVPAPHVSAAVPGGATFPASGGVTFPAPVTGSVVPLNSVASASVSSAPVFVVPAATAPAVAAPQALSLGTLSATQFNGLFRSLPTAPAMTTGFQLQGGAVSGVVESQVFQGTGAASGLYAYAYTVGASNPASVQGVSWNFGAAPVAASLAGGGSASAYAITGGQVGNLRLPAGTQGLSVSGLTWQSGGALTTTLSSQAGGGTTFVVITNQAPSFQQLVNVQGSSPLAPTSSLPVAYAP